LNHREGTVKLSAVGLGEAGVVGYLARMTTHRDPLFAGYRYPAERRWCTRWMEGEMTRAPGCYAMRRWQRTDFGRPAARVSAWFRISHSWVTEDERKPPACEGRMADFDWMGWRVEEAVDLRRVRLAEAEVVR
jgi:hypothetical protein